MSRRPAPGRMPAREADPAYDDDGRPSKSQRKRESHALQALGEDVAALPASRLDALDLPPALREAVAEFQRTRSHEGRRRQMQYIGKLMRSIDPAPLEEAVAAQRLGGARQTLALHEAERWRAALLADDAALTRWVAEHPQADVQRLRALVRSARDDARAEAQPGAAPRQGRAFRELFQIVKESLST